MPLDEKQFYSETRAVKQIPLNCSWCRQQETYDTNWMVRTKKDRIPGGADERDRAKFAKSQSYMVLLDTQMMCKNMRCRKRFDSSGVKTMAFL